jgi:adenosine deaminase
MWRYKCTLEPELIFDLATRNGITLPTDPVYASVETLKQRYVYLRVEEDFGVVDAVCVRLLEICPG